MKKPLFALPILLISCQPAFALDWDAIAKIESSGNWQAVGDNGKSFGLWQINEKTIMDYNRNGSKSGRKAVLSKDLLEIGSGQGVQADIRDFKHLNDKKTLKRLGIPVTEENLLICWNAGAGVLKSGRKVPESTRRYVKKYYKVKNEKGNKSK